MCLRLFSCFCLCGEHENCPPSSRKKLPLYLINRYLHITPGGRNRDRANFKLNGVVLADTSTGVTANTLLSRWGLTGMPAGLKHFESCRILYRKAKWRWNLLGGSSSIPGFARTWEVWRVAHFIKPSVFLKLWAWCFAQVKTAKGTDVANFKCTGGRQTLLSNGVLERAFLGAEPGDLCLGALPAS